MTPQPMRAEGLEFLEIVTVGCAFISPLQMIIPSNWVSPFFIIYGVCMILAIITWSLLHLWKNRNQKKEITEWVKAMKHGRIMYHPLLHWIKNNRDLSINTRAYSSDNEECKKRKMWKAQNVLPTRYKRTQINSGAFNHKTNDNLQIGNKYFPKSPVDVSSHEVSWIHDQPNKDKAKYFSFSSTAKSLKNILPTSPSTDE